MDKRANDADDYNNDGNGDSSDDECWPCGLFVINPPLVSWIAIDGTDTGNRRAG